MTATHTVTKPSGWWGKKGDRYWHKTTKYGVRSKCTDCGKEALGWGIDIDRGFHKDTCPRLAGPRKEWKGYVNATGKVCVHRLAVEQDGCFITRLEALLALDAELVAETERIAALRAEVAKMIADGEVSP